jgi:sodium/potassium-transporting ATPase subunit alpha
VYVCPVLRQNRYTYNGCDGQWIWNPSSQAFQIELRFQTVNTIAFVDEQFHVDSIAEKSNNKMKAFKFFHMIARLCNGAKLDEGTAGLPFEAQTIKGDPTDTALLRFAEPFSHPEIGINTPHLLASWEKVFEIPFNSKNKWMLTVVRERKTVQQEIDTVDPECWMLVKGAPDMLFPSCSDIMKADGTVVRLDEPTLARVSTLQAEWSNSGLRVLALCRRSLASAKMNPDTMSAALMEETIHSEFRDLTLVGLVGIRDPPRPDVPDAIRIIRRAGVRVFMVTGDFKLTALAIAKQVSIMHLLVGRCHGLLLIRLTRSVLLVKRKSILSSRCGLPSMRAAL